MSKDWNAAIMAALALILGTYIYQNYLKQVV